MFKKNPSPGLEELKYDLIKFQIVQAYHKVGKQVGSLFIAYASQALTENDRYLLQSHKDA